MGNFIIGMFNGIIKGMATALGAVVNILPNSPFQAIDNTAVGEFLGSLAWIIPIPQIIAILQAWVVAVGIYYLVQVILRWVKAIE